MAPAILTSNGINNGTDIDMTFASRPTGNGSNTSNGTVLTSSTITGTASLNNRILILGSLEAAQSGRYQSAVEEAGMGGVQQVEMHMIDRITSGNVLLDSGVYSQINVIAPWSTDLQKLFTQTIPDALQSNGTLVVETLSQNESIQQILRQLESELGTRGFADIQIDEVSGKISAKKQRSSALPLRRKLNGKSTTSEKKKALWNTTPSNVTLIDQNSLLSEEDKLVPNAITREDCDPTSALAGGKRKKACKGCTCGLREIEEEEEKQRQNGIIKLDENDISGVNGTNPGEKTEVTETMVDENGITRVIKRVTVDTKGATSSCGSCFLGDAFRCSSCPYLGLPAFKPGEKVEIPSFMDDDL